MTEIALPVKKLEKLTINNNKRTNGTNTPALLQSMIPL
jgi:hypothetical protein